MRLCGQAKSDRLDKPLADSASRGASGQNDLGTLNRRERLLIRYAVKDGNFQWVQFPPGDGSLQPEAVGAVVEVTKLLKYFDVTGHLG